MKIMLIDGNSLTYRAFFALPTDLTTASGQVTNAVFGFTSMLINLVRDHTPDRVIVTFDRPEPTFRHEMVETYKANRSETPDILRQQMGLVRQVVEALGLPILDQAGFEADDIIATLATTRPRQRRRRAHRHRRPRQLPAGRGPARQGALQQAGRVRLRALRRGRHPRAHRRAPRRATSSTPRCAATRPTTCPACPGVGEKTAAKLITKYGGLDGIFAHVDEQTPKLRQNLVEHEAQARTQRRDDGAAARRRPGRRARGAAPRRDRRRRGPEALRVPRVPHALRAAGRGVRPRRRARRRRGRRARGRGRRDGRRGRGRVALLDDAGRRRPRPLAVAGGWDGKAENRRGPARPGPGPRRRRRATWPGSRPALLVRRRGPRRARRRWSARAAGRSPPTGPRSSCGRCVGRYERRRAHAGHRHRAGRLPARPGRVPLPARRARRPLRPPAAARRRRRRRRASSTSAASRWPRRSRRPAGRSGSTRSCRRCSPRSTPRACAGCTTTSRCRSSGCWPAWRPSASASTSSGCGR